MRADDDVIARREQLVDDLSAVLLQNGALSPRGREQHRPLVRRRRPGIAQAAGHLIHVGDADLHELLFRQTAQLLERAHVLHLILARQQHRVIVVDAEHAIRHGLARGVEHVDIASNVLRALPLVDVQPRRRREHHRRLEEVQLREGLVAVADELPLDVFIGVIYGGVVGGSGHVYHVHPAPVQLAADGLEHIPVPLVVREDDERQLLRVPLHLLAAAQNKAELDDPGLEQVVQRPDDSDQDRKEHAARARINVQSHSRSPSSCRTRILTQKSGSAAQRPGAPQTDTAVLHGIYTDNDIIFHHAPSCKHFFPFSARGKAAVPPAGYFLSPEKESTQRMPPKPAV